MLVPLQTRGVFFHKVTSNWNSNVYYESTPFMLGIVIVILFLSNMGNAFCFVRWLSETGAMNLDWTIVSWAAPVLGNIWVNIAITAACAVFLGKSIVIRHGESGRWVLTEKIKWGAKFESQARAERKMYREYKNIYSALDRFMEIRHDKMQPGAWDCMNSQLLGIYDMLSMGLGKRTLPLKEEINSLSDDDEMFPMLIEQARGFCAELSELVDIWMSDYGFNGVRVGYNGEDDEQALMRVAKSMGLDSIVDSYYAGVPIEDLLA